MTLLRNGISVLFAKATTARLPTTPLIGTINPTYYGSANTLLTQLNMLATSPWVFAVVGRIARAVADAEWVLHQQMSDGTKRVVENHPFMWLWPNWSPIQTDDDALETIAQHLALVGEAWIVIIRNGAGIPVELQIVRPDRMFPIPDATRAGLSGYRYQIGNVKYDLPLEDVVFIRRPSPIDPYRGMGPLGSLLLDLEGERAATAYMTNFFRNDAEPGGILKFEENLSDADFERLVTRWNLQHRGVSNAHRVAVIERGEWVERRYTTRDMQFEQLRHFNRDIILGTFGIPRSVMGITEDVNRANAEAGMYLFARWVVKPELERIRTAFNQKLVSQYGPEGICLDFLDPVPENREMDHLVAKEGYQAGYLTMNEARYLDDHPVIEGGDTYYTPPPAPTFGLAATPPMLKAVTKAEEPTALARREERDMESGWRLRLEKERDAFLEYFLPGIRSRTLPEASGVDAFDWDWWARYSDDVIAELERAFSAAVLSIMPNADPTLLTVRASQWAEVRAARLLRLDGDMNLANLTRERIRQLVADSIRNGDSPQSLARLIRDDDVFSRVRARTIARTETMTALGQGQKQGAIMDGDDEKRWMSQRDALVRPSHAENDAAGWIAIEDAFPSGEDTIGEGSAEEVINCRCTVIYRHRPLSDVNPEEALAEENPQTIAQSRGNRRRVRKTIERDAAGRIVAVVEEEIDAEG